MQKYVFTDELTGEVAVPPSKKLEDLTHLADLCVDLLQQNNEQYSEVRLWLCLDRACLLNR